MKAVTELNWGFTTETLVATYKAIVRPILDYADSIWFTQVLPSHLFKLEVIQNKARRIATFCHQKAAVSHLRSETRVLPWGRIRNCVHSSSILASFHPSYLIVTSPPIDPRPLRVTLQPSHHRVLRDLRAKGDYPNTPLIFGACWRWAVIPWKDASYEAGWLVRSPGLGYSSPGPSRRTVEYRGRRLHLPRLSCRRPHCGPPLQLSHTSTPPG